MVLGVGNGGATKVADEPEEAVESEDRATKVADEPVELEDLEDLDDLDDLEDLIGVATGDGRKERCGGVEGGIAVWMEAAVEVNNGVVERKVRRSRRSVTSLDASPVFR